ncbi:hypothetical protein [Mycoplasma sp. 4F]|uniref:hypothetical protein n=1 Tax=Mycoplasma sp. 4F TaxID=3401664 RepID=UPI003AAF15C8
MFFRSKKQFTVEQKLKYINLALNKGIEYAQIEFVEEFWEERYKDTYTSYVGRKHNVNPYRYAYKYIKYWINIYNTDMTKLKSQTEKKS